MITVYSKPDCMQCRMTYKAMDAKGLAYQVVDVTENMGALEYVKELGYLTAPVIVVSEHDHWGGSDPTTSTGWPPGERPRTRRPWT